MSARNHPDPWPQTTAGIAIYRLGGVGGEFATSPLPVRPTAH
jgi:hypothetical protein